MKQLTRFCSCLDSWRRPLAAAGIGVGLALVPLSAKADKPSLRHTTTVLAIQQAEPAVVNIEGNKPASSNSMARGDSPQVNGMGAGIIIDPRGYILTNQHVVQDVTRIEVTLHSGAQHVGKLIARDAETDLALIKIDSKTALPVVRFGTSSDLMRGEPVIAIGNPFGYHHTVTEGIISALHRDIPVNGSQEYPDLIQTDASINPGNSGGPLLNADGLMVGINAAVRIGAQGIGFAIPVDRAAEVAAEMISQHRRGLFESPLAVKTDYESGTTRLVVVGGDSSEVRKGDVITSVGELPVNKRLDYELALIGYDAGSEIPIVVERHGETISASLSVGSQSSTPARFASTGSVKDVVFRDLGLRLDIANANQVRRVDSSYKGGLRVTAVRQNSPADIAQIQVGDVLVGLMEWQTPDWDDLAWILKSGEFRAASSPKFHIMRGSEVFWGSLEISTTR